MSTDCLSPITAISLYPLSEAAIASATPVFPEVGSMIVPPGFSHPLRSARSIIATPIRSFDEPPGFRYSSLATRLPWGWMRPSRTIGVLPIVSTMWS